MDEYLRFKSAIFCSRHYNFLRFSDHNLPLILSSRLCLNLIIPNITLGLYMEGTFRFKSWFLNAPELMHGGACYRNFTVILINLVTTSLAI